MKEKRCRCKHCLNSKSVPRFLITDNPTEAAAIFTQDILSNSEFCRRLGHEDGMIQDTILEKTLSEYGIQFRNDRQDATALDSPVVRISCHENAGSVGDLKEYGFSVEIIEIDSEAYQDYQRQFGDAVNNAASINHKIAVLRIPELRVYRAAGMLICDNCHLVIDAKDVVTNQNQEYCIRNSRSQLDHCQEYTITLLAPPYAGKTALLLSIYYNYLGTAENAPFRRACMEPYFDKYFREASIRLLRHKKVPANTKNLQPPLSFLMTEHQTLIHILDTKGEDILNCNTEPANQSDAIIVLFSMKDEQTDTGISVQDNLEEIENLEEFLCALESSLMTITNGSEIKPVILCFTKCDLYPETAERIMLYTDEKSRNKEEKQHLLRILRNYNFHQNHRSFIRSIYQEITGADSNQHEEFIQGFSGAFSHIFGYCQSISKGALDLLCIAPMGVTILENDTEQNRRDKKLNPLYMKEFMKFIENYCKGLK